MKIFRPALLALTLLPALATHADDLSEPRHITVTYSDLNLKTAAGAQTLYRRINTAALSVCHDLETKVLSGRSYWNQCMNQAISHAVLDVDAPMLTAYYTKEGNGQTQVALAGEL